MTQDDIASLDPAVVARAIGMGLSSWAGNCYAVATQMLRHRIVDGFAVYGHYCGPISPASPFANRIGGIVRHGWIETSDGLLIDPTRFVFEARAPYISCRLRAKALAEYDEGGDRLRRVMLGSRSAPAFDPKAKQLAVPKEAAGPIACLVGRPPDTLSITIAEAFWIANLPYSFLAADSTAIYAGLTGMGQEAFIPIDNRLRAQRQTA